MQKMAGNSYADQKVYHSKILGVTKGKLFELTYEWKIHNINIVGKKKSEYLSSAIFSSPNNIKIKWQLLLYPKGKYANENNMSVDLKFHPSYNYREIEADYKISILNNENKSVRCKWATNFFTYSDNCRGFTFEINSHILQCENIVLNGCLTLVCEISYCTDVVNWPNEIDEIPNFIDPSFGKLQSGYKSLFNSQALSDVTLSASGQKLHAHKAILAAQSPVFLAMFDNDMKEKSDNRVDITDVDFSILQEMLRYVYTGEVEMTDDETVDDLLAFAEKYNIEALKNECEQYFCKKVNVDNVMDLYRIADRYNAWILKKYALKFMRIHREELLRKNVVELNESLEPVVLAELTRELIGEAEANYYLVVKKLNSVFKYGFFIACTVATAFILKKMISSCNDQIVTNPPVPQNFPIPQIDYLLSQIDLPTLQMESMGSFPKIESANPFEFFKRALG